jgi:hypothetical protein
MRTEGNCMTLVYLIFRAKDPCLFTSKDDAVSGLAFHYHGKVHAGASLSAPPFITYIPPPASISDIVFIIGELEYLHAPMGTGSHSEWLV